MRWTNTGADLIRAQARDGAELRSIDEPRAEPDEAGFRDRGVRLRGRDQGGKNWEAVIYSPHGNGWAAEEPDHIIATCCRSPK